MPNYYWDACVILEYLNGSPSRAPHVNSMLDAASRGQINIFTSTLSIAEVAYASHDKTNGEISDDTVRSINALWRVGSPIKLIEFHRLFAESACLLSREAMVSRIKPARSVDLMHLATAKFLKVDEFHTYEEEKTRQSWQSLTQLKVCEPISSSPQLPL